jgi:signal transduction histidine kinase
MAEAGGMTVVVEPSPGRIEVDVDAGFASQILMPVLENALRYGRSKVSIRVTRDGGAVDFTVCDDGPGVRPEEAEVVFVPGARGSAARGKRGSGLGLSLARRLARSAGGDVVARAPEHGGGELVIKLPAG